MESCHQLIYNLSYEGLWLTINLALKLHLRNKSPVESI